MGILRNLAIAAAMQFYAAALSAQDTIKIGADLPMSGPNAEYGELFGAAAATADRHPIAGADPAGATAQLGRPGLWSDRLPHFRSGFVPSAGDEIQSSTSSTGDTVPPPWRRSSASATGFDRCCTSRRSARSQLTTCG